MRFGGDLTAATFLVVMQLAGNVNAGSEGRERWVETPTAWLYRAIDSSGAVSYESKILKDPKAGRWIDEHRRRIVEAAMPRFRGSKSDVRFYRFREGDVEWRADKTSIEAIKVRSQKDGRSVYFVTFDYYSEPQTKPATADFAAYSVLGLIRETAEGLAFEQADQFSSNNHVSAHVEPLNHNGRVLAKASISASHGDCTPRRLTSEVRIYDIKGDLPLPMFVYGRDLGTDWSSSSGWNDETVFQRAECRFSSRGAKLVVEERTVMETGRDTEEQTVKYGPWKTKAIVDDAELSR